MNESSLGLIWISIYEPFYRSRTPTSAHTRGGCERSADNRRLFRRLSATRFHQKPDVHGQIVVIDWLKHDVVCSRIQCAGGKRRIDDAGDEHDDGSFFVAAEFDHQAMTVESRHSEIADDNIELVLREQLLRFNSITRLHANESALAECSCRQVANCRFVIHTSRNTS